MSDPVTEYARDVQAGRQPACSFVRLAAQRHLEDLAVGDARGLRFEQREAERALRFISSLRQSKGEWAGQPLRLQPWQRFIVGSLFGWQRRVIQCAGCGAWLAEGDRCVPCDREPGGTVGWFRRFRNAYVEVPRKNGKTTLAAATALYLAFGDREPGAEVYSVATKKDQARICWDEARRMVMLSPALSRRVSVFRTALSREELAQRFVPLGADDDRMDGLNVHGAIVDELHAHRDSGIINVIETATGSRRQPLVLAITTAGWDKHSVCYERHDYGSHILSGTVQDDATFVFITSLDEGDDWRDQAVWRKANPNLGVSVRVDDLQAAVRRAQDLPAEQPLVLQKRFNVWTSQGKQAIDLNVWDAATAGCNVPDLEALRGRPVYAGLDLGAVDDMTALVLVSPHGDAVDVWCRFWVPEGALERSRYAGQYRLWASRGLLKIMPGNAQEYETLYVEIMTVLERVKPEAVVMDILFQGRPLWQMLERALGEDRLAQGRMGFLSMGPAMRELMRLLYARKLHHGGNAVLRWQAESLAVQQDAAGNLKPDKANSQGKIDGIVALCMALEAASRRHEKVILRAV